MLKRRRPGELILWRYSECPDCEFVEQCPRKVANLTTCLNEFEDLFSEDPIGLLARRTTQALTMEMRRKGKVNLNSGPRRIGFMFPNTPSVRYNSNAHLTCTDSVEFIKCLPARSE